LCWRGLYCCSMLDWKLGWSPQSICPSSSKPPCKSTTFVYVEDSRECIDYQEIKIQEQMQTLTVGSIPRSIVVVLENDLVDTCKVFVFTTFMHWVNTCLFLCVFSNQAGDDVVVSGILTRRWGRVARGARFDTEVVIRANHIRLHHVTVSTGVLTDGRRCCEWRTWLCLNGFLHQIFKPNFERFGVPIQPTRSLAETLSCNPCVHKCLGCVSLRWV
jgi:MCM OB domain